MRFSNAIVISSDVDFPVLVQAQDIDGDGDDDLLSVSTGDSKVAWYENIDGRGTFGPQRIIATISTGATTAFAADLDGDGDLDVIVGSGSGGRIDWYENLLSVGQGGASGFSTRQIVTTNVGYVRSVFAADLDGDGDLDVLSASTTDDTVAWYENTNGNGSFGPQRVITAFAPKAVSVFAADIDGDGDVDVLSASTQNDNAAWYENLNGQGVFGEQQIITMQVNLPLSVFASDLDGDGDADVLTASVLDDKIAWYENTDGQGNFGPQLVITTLAESANSVFAKDLDGDGDLDVLSSSGDDDKIAWYENQINGGGGGADGFGSQRVISSNVDNARFVFAADLDGDGDAEVLAASGADDQIVCFENRTLIDCNENTIPDECDINGSTSTDCNNNDVPDDCELVGNDCNHNGLPDECELADNDCNNDGIPDDCQLVANDCNDNGKPDDCEPAGDDCNANEVADGCDIAGGTSGDCNTNGVPDECETATEFSKHVLSNTAGNTFFARAEDLDGDGDNDVLAMTGLNSIGWFRNEDGLGTFGPEFRIMGDGAIVRSAYAVDLDGDGDTDVLSASQLDNKIAWHQNVAGMGIGWNSRTIATDAIDAFYVHAADLDGDGDADVLSASATDNKIAWYENLILEGGGGSDGFGPPQIISTDAQGARAVIAADLDGDGDNDVISASAEDNKIAWYENVDGFGTFGPVRAISFSAAFAYSVFAADIDGDGDLDILSASSHDDEIAWFENLINVGGGGADGFGPTQVITQEADWAQSVYAADMDGDGDLDALSASDNDHKISWYENLNGLGDFGPRRNIATSVNGAFYVFAADMDGDRDVDALSASRLDATVAWYENKGDDCNGNKIPDECELKNNDCNLNDVPDDCELDGNDCNNNGIPDECDEPVSANDDCNNNCIHDASDILSGTSLDCDQNGVPDECQGSDWVENFENDSIGQDPDNWFDTAAGSSTTEADNFEVELVGSELVLGTQSTETNLHSHYVGPEAQGVSNMTLTGRLRIDDADAGIGVTFLSQFSDQPSSTYEYLRIRRANYAPSAQTFHLAPPNFDNFVGVVDSGVNPSTNTWYRFRIVVDTTGAQLHVQARFWEDGQPEPGGFQIDAVDPSGLHPTSGTFGVWSMGGGGKFWDDFELFTVPPIIPCDDGEACTTCDIVRGESCSGLPVDCSHLDDDCNVFACNPAIGSCDASWVNEGGGCDDFNPCTINELCELGACIGEQVDCSHLDIDCTAGVCNEETGLCETTEAPDGTACDDLNGCTQGDACGDGVCVGVPVDCTSFDNECLLASCDPEIGMCEVEEFIDCNSNGLPDICEFQVSIGNQQIISSALDGPTSVVATDVDGDGDIDVLASAQSSNKIVWYENIDGQGAFGSQKVITQSAVGAYDIYAADLDGDGDDDIVAGLRGVGEVVWYENTGGAAQFGFKRVVSNEVTSPYGVFAKDLDGDGDIDVLSASSIDDKIAWYENADGQGTFGPQRIITTTADFAFSVFAVDLDGDGDTDVLSASTVDETIAWYENIDGLGTFGSSQIIASSASDAREVIAADLDGDGDPDVLAAQGNRIAWYENITEGGEGAFGPRQVITNSVSGAVSVFAIDLDGDEDIDVLSTSWLDDKVAWYENINGRGTFGPQQVINSSTDRPISVTAADLDGDGDPDVLAAFSEDNIIAWYSNTALNDCDENKVLDDCDSDIDGDALIDDCDPCAGGMASGDSDGDGSVDLFDYSGFEQCVESHEVIEDQGCECFDFDEDGDNDLQDFAAFQRAFGP
ncbi:MAG: VCBS repeat-containing protein [Phycisphaerales bacterium]|nr:VCBS repeat-containing protein [Phycisphaerales bacterium]